MSKRILFLLAGVILLLSLTPALAQSDWCYFFDFTLDEQDWTISGGGGVGQYIEGQGWGDVYPPVDGIYITSPTWVDTGVVIDLTVYGNFLVSLGGFVIRDADTDPLYCPTPETAFDEGDQWLYPHACNDTLSSGGQMEVVYDACIGSGCDTDFIIQGIEMQGTGDSPMGESNCGGAFASFTADPESGAAPLEVEFTDTSDAVGEITGWSWDFDDGETSEAQNPTHTFEEPGTYTVTLTITTTTGDDSYEMDITVTGGGVPGGGLSRPLAAEDEHPQWGMYDPLYVEELDPEYEVTTSYPNSVYAFANQPHANVSAVAAGTVIDVRPFDRPKDCVFKIGSLIACLIIIPQPITQEDVAFVFHIETTRLSQIRIRDEENPDLVYTYYVTSTTLQVGDSVVAGCIIGKTIQLKNMGPLEMGDINAGISLSIGEGGPGGGFSIGGSATFRSLLVDFGYTVVMLANEGESVRLFPSLTVPPDQSNCKDQTLSGCMNANPDLRAVDGISIDDYRYDSGVVALDSGGVSIPQDLTISQDGIVTLAGTTYVLSVQARDARVGDDEAGTIRLSVTDGLNQDFQDYQLNIDGQWENYTFIPEGLEPGPISFSISNGGGGAVEVRYACFAPSTVSTAPGSCYFANPEFDADASNWTFTGVTFASGQAYMFNSSILSQVVTLNPTDESESHTYTVSAQVRLIATTAYTGQVGKSVTLNYRYDTEEYSELGTVDSALVLTEGVNLVSGAVNIDYPYSFEATVEVSEETTTDFTFQVSVTDVDNYIIGLRIDRLCLKPSTDDGSFPGQPGGGGFIPPLIVGCSVVPLPLDGSVAAWTFYHWSQLKRFFNCDLMKLLNKWFQLFDTFRKTMLNVARYWIATVHHVSRWATTVFWWFNGQLRNVAEGQVIVISGGDTGCHDLFCAITDVVGTLASLLNPIVAALNNVVNVLLGVLIGAVNLFFTLVGGLIGFVVALLIKLFTFLSSAVGLLAALVTAFNTATPTAIPGLPTCALDPESSLLCRGVWVLDNTILGGRWGVLFIVLLSIFSIHLLIWAVDEFRDVLLKTWSSS